MGRSTGCSAHRTALAAFVEQSERGPATDVAFEHLDRCRRCQAELTELLLTVHAVRRTLAEAGCGRPTARCLGPPAQPGPGARRQRLGHALHAGQCGRRRRSGGGPDRSDRRPPAGRRRRARARSGARRPQGANGGRRAGRVRISESRSSRAPAQPGRAGRRRNGGVAGSGWARSGRCVDPRRGPAGAGRLTPIQAVGIEARRCS